MLIRRMAASFGCLQNHTLEFKEGLNIIQAPNETGKSTWCAFLTAMLYGINSRERDKAGFIAEKNRYAPWSGALMAGRVDCCAAGSELTLMRATRRPGAPMGEFKAVYTGTGDSVPHLSGQNCGETLLGVSREVFERSAFIRQAGLPISQDAGLERRIASLITCGEEDISYTEAREALKRQLNRRRHNKSGLLPALEEELSAAQEQLLRLQSLTQQLDALKPQLLRAEQAQAQLAEELEQHRRWEQQSSRRALAQAEEDLMLLRRLHAELKQEAEHDRIPPNETIARLRGAIVNLETTRKSVEKAREQRDAAMKVLLQAEAAVSESPFAGHSPESAKRAAASVPPIRPKPWWIPLAAVPAALCAAYLLSHGSFPISALAASVALLLSCLFLAWRSASDHKRRAAYLKSFHVASSEELNALLEIYLERHDRRDAAQEELDRLSAAADTLYNTLFSNEQAILLEVRRFAPTAFDIPTADRLLRECAARRKQLSESEAALRDAQVRRDTLAAQAGADSAEVPLPADRPPRPKETVAAQLEQVRTLLAEQRSAADRIAGQLETLGDPSVPEAEIRRLCREKETLESEYSSIRMAMEALDAANTALQNRFSPALGRRAAEIFSRLTDGSYTTVALDRSFRLCAGSASDPIQRDAQLLSAGTSDQLYLAVRLAICDLVLPKQTSVPIILDDALANFDDARCAAALRWLKEEAGHRQILLFTCHSREAEFFAEDDEVSIQQLTNAVEKV